MKFLTTLIAIFTLFGVATTLAQTKQPSPKKYSELELKIEKNYLLVPMSPKATYKKFKVLDSNGNVFGNYEGLLDAGKGLWRADINVSGLKGQTVKFVYEDDGSGAPTVTQNDVLPLSTVETDVGRPKYHFTPKFGWLNDPNGLVYFKGVWHLFYQYNPFSLHWKAPMHWGHAVSKDLMHWEYKPIAVYPKFDNNGNADQAFSGTAYYDVKNRSGLFGAGGGVIFAYTSTGRGECLMVSDDLINFRELPNNPIIKGAGRDPRLFFNEDSGKWTIIRYEEATIKGEKNPRKYFAIYVSDDLKKWRKTDELDGFYECPEMFKIRVTGAVDTPKWVIWDASGKYVVGDFDGEKFKQLSNKPLKLFMGDAYAAQVWNNAPNGRIIATAWIRQDSNLVRSIGQKFSQTMSLPWELKLVKMRDNQYQLRASVPNEVRQFIGNPKDAVGGTDFTFTSNVFDLPDARGNNLVFEGVVNLDLASAFRLEMGTSNVRYIPDTNNYVIARLDDVRKVEPAQSDPSKSFFLWRAFLDTYSSEYQFNEGEAVVCIGDSFLNPYQSLKIGGIGKLLVNCAYTMPMHKYTLQQRGEFARQRMEYLTRPQEDKDAKKSDTDKSTENSASAQKVAPTKSDAQNK